MIAPQHRNRAEGEALINRIAALYGISITIAPAITADKDARAILEDAKANPNPPASGSAVKRPRKTDPDVGGCGSGGLLSRLGGGALATEKGGTKAAKKDVLQRIGPQAAELPGNSGAASVSAKKVNAASMRRVGPPAQMPKSGLMARVGPAAVPPGVLDRVGPAAATSGTPKIRAPPPTAALGVLGRVGPAAKKTEISKPASAKPPGQKTGIRSRLGIGPLLSKDLMKLGR